MSAALEYINPADLEPPSATIWRLTRAGFGAGTAYTLLELLDAAADLPRKFGLSPSRPQFLFHAGLVPRLPAEARRHLVKRAAGVPPTAYGWTDRRTPGEPRLMLTESCKGSPCALRCNGFHFRPAGDVFEALVHETGHRIGLEFADLADWDNKPWLAADATCSPGVEEFTRHVAERSCPGVIRLGAYDELAARCRRAAGLYD